MLTASNLTLRDYLETLRRQRALIVVVFILTTVLGTLPAVLQKPVYSSHTTIQVSSDATQSPFDDPNSESAGLRFRDLSTDVELLKSSATTALVLDELGDRAEPFFGVNAAVVGASDVIRVTVSASSPAAAADAANAYATVFVEERRGRAIEALVAQSDELRTRAKRSSDQIAAIDVQLGDPDLDDFAADNLRVQRASLASQVLQFTVRADELDVEASLREGGTRIVSRAGLALTPVSPQPLRAAMIAAALGLLAGLGVAVVLDVVQDRLLGPEDLERIDPSLPVMAAIPYFDTAGGVTVSGSAMEAYRYLRASVRFLGVDTAAKSVMVTSATESEGKSTTAVNLARAVAESGARVVLIDADLRQPTIHDLLGLSNAIGLSDVLAGEADFSQAVEYVDATLAVLTAGQPSPLASELLGRDVFADLLRSVTSQCDLVLIDVPPVLPVADALLVGRAADCAVLVARVGAVRRRQLRQMVRRLTEARIRLGGFVANDVTERGESYYGTSESHAIES